MDRGEVWPGGHVRIDSRGRRVYWIRRLGREISTRASSLRAAMAHLERFEADPEGYDPRDMSRDAIDLSPELVEKFLAHSRRRGNTPAWRRDQRRYLAWWTTALGGRDLRRLSAPTALELAGHGGYNRVAVLRAFLGWARKSGILSRAHGPDLEALRVEASHAEQLRRDKVVTPERFDAVLSHLTGPYRHALIVLGATGWHVTELHRFARRGRIDRTVLVCPWHKSGEPHRTDVSARALPSARALLKHGGFSISRLDRALRAAANAAGVEEFGAGQMRHSVATWAVEAGASIQAVAEFLGHRSPATTKKFYATHATAARVPTPLIDGDTENLGSRRVRGKRT